MYVCWGPWGILFLIYLGLRDSNNKRQEGWEEKEEG